jgi:hypothetical protein
MSGAVVKKFVSSQIGRSIEVLRKKENRKCGGGGREKNFPPECGCTGEKMKNSDGGGGGYD